MMGSGLHRIGGAAFLSSLVMTGCRFSIMERDESAGFNGGFETVMSGVSVNWYFHYPPIKN